MDAAYGGVAVNVLVERNMAACSGCDWKLFGVIANACFGFGKIGKWLQIGRLELD